MARASREMRVWFLFFAAFLWLGIWLTGFGQAHWLLYVPAVLLVVAGLSGFCLTQMMVFPLVPKKRSEG